MLTTLLKTSLWLRPAGTSGTAGIRDPSSAIRMSDLRPHGTQTTDLLLPWKNAKTIWLSAVIRILKCKKFQKVLPVPVVLSWREVKTISSLIHDGLLRCLSWFSGPWVTMGWDSCLDAPMPCCPAARPSIEPGGSVRGDHCTLLSSPELFPHLTKSIKYRSKTSACDQGKDHGIYVNMVL